MSGFLCALNTKIHISHWPLCDCYIQYSGLCKHNISLCSIFFDLFRPLAVHPLIRNSHSVAFRYPPLPLAG
jgi:hypothetical protein